MSGHSKWANIKHKKGKSDAARSNIFTKLGRELAIAVKQGGADPASNSRLRDVIAKAKANNMPNDNINRSIKKASGDMDGVNYEEITYEGYGPGGVAFIVETLTDNKNRTAGDVRHLFDRFGGSLGANGCVSYMFNKKGVIVVDRASIEEDELMMMAIEVGAEDVVAEEEVFEVYTSLSDFNAVREALEKEELNILSAELDMVPDNEIESEAKHVDSLLKFIDKLEDLDDVQNIYHNGIFGDEE